MPPRTITIATAAETTATAATADTSAGRCSHVMLRRSASSGTVLSCPNGGCLRLRQRRSPFYGVVKIQRVVSSCRIAWRPYIPAMTDATTSVHADSARPTPDLFDEPARPRIASYAGAISPITLTPTGEAGREYRPLRWQLALVAGAVAAGVGLVSNFPVWAVAALGITASAAYLWRLPQFAKRLWLIAVGAFFFAQSTTIFINIPFTRAMRIVFAAVLLAAATYLRVSGDE